MEIAEGALAMAAKNKINTEIAGLAKPQTTKRTHKIKLKKTSPRTRGYQRGDLCVRHSCLSPASAR